jgi:vacuolar-type H+-ATPase subunit I/STV1
MQDIRDRQRNIVFPDTVNNEARFWRNIFEGRQRLTLVGKIGLSILVFAMAVLVFLISFGGNIPFKANFSWSKLLSAVILWFVAFGILALILLAFRISRWFQRK